MRGKCLLAAWRPVGQLPDILTVLNSCCLLYDLLGLGSLSSMTFWLLGFGPNVASGLTFSRPQKLSFSIGERWLPECLLSTCSVVRRSLSASSASSSSIQIPVYLALLDFVRASAAAPILECCLSTSVSSLGPTFLKNVHQHVDSCPRVTLDR